MSLTMNLVAILPISEEWKKMKAVWDSCSEAGVDIPDEVFNFFDGEEPEEDLKGVVFPIDNHDSVKDWTGTGEDGGTGYEVDLAHLPTGTTQLRFYLT